MISGIFILIFQEDNMTRITPIKENNKLIGFKVDGHANSSSYGTDIVCAAVSVLSINTINSLQVIAHKELDVWEEDGYLEYHIRGNSTPQSNVLLQSAMLGYRSTAEQYPEYVCIATSQ